MFGFLKNLIKFNVARWSDGTGDSLIQPSGSVVQYPKIIKFPDFAPSLIGALVAGATYAQSGNIVTVTATAHGLPTNKNGYRFYFPGATAVPAGWYSNFTHVDVNTFTFENPTSQTVAPGTAISDVPWTTATTVASVVLPANTLGSNGAVSLKIIRSGDQNSTSSKYSRLNIAGVTRNSALVAGGSALVSGSQTAYVQVVPGAFGGTFLVSGSFGGTDGTVNTAVNMYRTSFNPAVANTVSIDGFLKLATGWISIDAAMLEVIQ